MDETTETLAQNVETSKTHWVNLDERIFQKLERLKEQTGCKSTTEMMEEIIGYYTRN
jgi:hypothetical protein